MEATDTTIDSPGPLAPHIEDVERELVPAFSATHPSAMPSAFVRAAVRLVALVCADRDTFRVRFAQLDPHALLAELQRPRDPVEPFVADFLAVAGDFYRWLGDTGRIDRTRAESIALGLDALAIRQ